MKLNLRKGSKIVEVGKVYFVNEIKKKKFNGKTESYIYYKPFFKTKGNRSIICCIPQSNIDKTTIRKPLEPEKITKILKRLARKKAINSFENSDAKDILKLNRLDKTALVARKFWTKKNSEDDKLSFSQKRVLDEAISSLSQEIAVVKGIKLESAEKLIIDTLQS